MATEYVNSLVLTKPTSTVSATSSTTTSGKMDGYIYTKENSTTAISGSSSAFHGVSLMDSTTTSTVPSGTIANLPNLLDERLTGVYSKSTKGTRIKSSLTAKNSLLSLDVTDSTSDTWDAGRFFNQDEIMKRFHMGNEWGSQSNNDVFSSGYDDPTNLTFKVEFGEWGASLLDETTIKQQQSTSKFSNVYNEDYDAFPMGLLNLNFMEFDGSESWNDLELYNTYNYLMNNNEDSRAAYIKLFVKGLYTIQRDMPYIFTKISGLDSLQRFDPTKGVRLKDAKITLECIEGLDLKIRTLLLLYRKAAYDDVYQRWVLPDIYRFFKMIIYVFDRRNLLTGAGTYSVEQDNFPIYAYECDMCLFDIAATFESDYSTSWGELKNALTNIVINVKNVKTYFANKLFNKIDSLASKVNWISDFNSVTQRGTYTFPDMSNYGDFRMRWLQHMFMMPSEFKAYYTNNTTHKIGDESDVEDEVYYYGPDMPTDTWHYAIVTDNIYNINSWKDLLHYLKKAITSRSVLVRDSRYSENRDRFSNDLTRPEEWSYRYSHKMMEYGPDVKRALEQMRNRVEILLQHMLNSTYVKDTSVYYNLVDIRLNDSSVNSSIINVKMQEPYTLVHAPYIKPNMNLDKPEQNLISNFVDTPLALMEMVEPILDTSAPDMEYVKPITNTTKVEQTYVKPDMNTSTAEMEMIEPILLDHIVDMEMVEPILDTSVAPLNFIEMILNLEKPSQTFVEPIIDTEKAELQLVEMLQDLHKPDMEMVEPIIDESKPDMEMVEPIFDESKPDMVMVEPIFDESKSDMVMVEPIFDEELVHAPMVEPIFDESKPDMVMVEPVFDETKPEMELVSPNIDTEIPSMNLIPNYSDDINNHELLDIRPIDSSEHPEMTMVEPIMDTHHEQHNFIKNELNLDHLDLEMTPLLITDKDTHMNFTELVIEDVPENQKPMTTLEPVIELTPNLDMIPLEGNDFKPEMDMTVLEGNDFKPEMDMTHIKENLFIPDLKLTHVKDTSYNPEFKMTELILNTSIPELVMQTVNTETTLPEMDMVELPINDEKHEMVMIEPNKDTSIADMVMIEPNKDTSIADMVMQSLETYEYDNNMVMTEPIINDSKNTKHQFTNVDLNIEKPVESPMTQLINHDAVDSMSYVKPIITDKSNSSTYVRPIDSEKTNINTNSFVNQEINDKTEIPTSALFDAIVDNLTDKIKMQMVNISDSPKLVQKILALTRIDTKQLKSANIEELVSLANIIEETYNEIRERESNMKMQDNYPRKEQKKEKQKMQGIELPPRNAILSKKLSKVDQEAIDRAWEAKKAADEDKK